ncbi:MAG TPA: HD domain-containing protein, partial [Kofleriaceae bacterium]|nr:HD domain-containing protein [Kofleriaceae bacterium]
MAGPPRVGAIDAGSNAIRLLIAEPGAHGYPRRVLGLRVPIRLGHGAFTVGELHPGTVDAAVAAFVRFRGLFNEHQVLRYRAVTTSAVRDARNRDVLVHRIHAESGIELEVITGDEEARLVRKAVRNAMRGRPQPASVLDLGGGSLEVNLRNVARWVSASLPIGTVRLIETLGLTGAIGDDEARMVRRYVHTLLEISLREQSARDLSPSAACGGNAEALARLFGGGDGAARALPRAALESALPELLALDVPGRMARYGVRRDRAEVMGVAALVLATSAEMLGVDRFLVPGVGIRDALAFELAATLPLRNRTGAGTLDAVRRKAALTSARMFSARLGHDLHHGEQVRRLALALFDQTRRLHGLADDARAALELAALLHDIGESINSRAHHRHGEYLVRSGRIAELDDDTRNMVAALIRSHRRAQPSARKHPAYAALSSRARRHMRTLLGILRLADGLDTEHQQRVRNLTVVRRGHRIDLRLDMTGS